MTSLPESSEQFPILSNEWVERHLPPLDSLTEPQRIAEWVYRFLLNDQIIPECNDGDATTVWTRLDQRFGHQDVEWNEPTKSVTQVNEILSDHTDYIDAAENPHTMIQNLLCMTAIFLKVQVAKFPDHKERIAHTASECYSTFMTRELRRRPDLRELLMQRPLTCLIC
ncbi:hypothetical protein JTE90_002482 [Oedothorax gibbosus]|uniref:Uncharacterized protein n=1 Tax=Oedothorax gibbosus TaxID=931172 RepID=A0AAV6TSF2_9ARAC|nr:hypothetical protein JTE90_002482 [Oedothorax gibbosus]